ncbi:LysR family transcriptional regulator [Thioclava sp. FR2]|uniref:LysR family transcriptional regulator n=1 Tax=Thioclava sp. FR2 TaxID=3445780 RepID=UPI003EB9CB40
MSGLTALEALDRLGTASAVAEELSLTQGAISRALQSLEAQLGVSLIVRDKKRLKLTPAAQDYVLQIRRSLHTIAAASSNLRSNPAGGSLSLAILPAFGEYWLAPRLALFVKEHPQLTVNLSTRLQTFDLEDSEFDAAIHFGRADWPAADHLLLLEESVLPVCSPKLLTSSVREPADLVAFPLLQLKSRPGAWKRYLASQGVDHRQPQGMRFDQFATMKQAAIHGLGVALLPSFMIEDSLKTGELVTPWNQPGQGLGSYYLVWPKDLPQRETFRTFCDWLKSELSSLDPDQTRAGTRV